MGLEKFNDKIQLFESGMNTPDPHLECATVTRIQPWLGSTQRTDIPHVPYEQIHDMKVVLAKLFDEEESLPRLDLT